jgi:hypothetical protein
MFGFGLSLWLCMIDLILHLLEENCTRRHKRYLSVENRRLQVSFYEKERSLRFFIGWECVFLLLVELIDLLIA